MRVVQVLVQHGHVATHRDLHKQKGKTGKANAFWAPFHSSFISFSFSSPFQGCFPIRKTFLFWSLKKTCIQYSNHVDMFGIAHLVWGVREGEAR